MTSERLKNPDWQDQWTGFDLSRVLLIWASGDHRNGPGDSGGAMYAIDADGNIILVGVISGNATPTGELTDVVASIGTNLTADSVLKFIHEVIDADL